MNGLRSGSLEHVVARTPVDGHDGRSGARLERVVLDDGTRLIVKTSGLSDDLGATMSGDTSGRELDLWRAGVLDELPRGVDHCVVDGWRDSEGRVVTVMRDLGAAVIGWDHRLSHAACRRVLAAAADVHRHFLGRPPAGLCPLERYLVALSPASAATGVGGPNPLPGLIVRGWELAAELVPDDVWVATQRVFADPHPLAARLRQAGTTLVHGDLWPVNVALELDQVTLLDWGLATEAPGAVDVAAFVAGSGGIAAATREQLIALYVEHAPADPADVSAALVVGFLQYGWNKALDAAEHPDPAVRARELADLGWWVAAARVAFER